MTAIMRSLSSCFEVTRMWRSTERASLEKKPSMRLSHDQAGREGELEASGRPSGEPAVVSREIWAEWLSRMISIAVWPDKRRRGA